MNKNVRLFSDKTKMNWKILVTLGTAYLRAAGEAKKAEDTNTTGKDDATGVIMVFAADVTDALVLGRKLPKIPAEYKAGEIVK